MSTQTVRGRVERLEQRFSKKDPNSYTAERYCREMWREDKENYLRIAGERVSSYRRDLIPQFEKEDAERVQTCSDGRKVVAEEPNDTKPRVIDWTVAELRKVMEG